MKGGRVLFVTYEFPPESPRGTKRSVKFIRYLPKNHWSAVVLTVRSRNWMFRDKSLLTELPSDLAVYRAWTLENLVQKDPGAQASAGKMVGEAKKASSYSPLRLAVLWLYRGIGRFTKIPDSRILWLPFAVIKGLRAVNRHGCRLIYSSGPTHTNHVVGAVLARLTRLPLVMDFRDAWVGNPVDQPEQAYLIKSNIYLERFCVRSAKRVVCTTDGIKEDFENRYRDHNGKFITITNGFDPSDFQSGTPPPPHSDHSTFRLVHAGTLGGVRSPKEFLMALGELLQGNPQLRDRIEIVFVGKNSRFADGRRVEDYVEEYGCDEVVKLTGFVSRKESLDYMIQANMLLLIIGRVPKEGAYTYGISGKIYDYAAAAKPVLTVSEPGSTAEMAQRLNLGPVVSPDDIEGIKANLLYLCAAHHLGSIDYRPNLRLLTEFNFSCLTSRLAKCFDTACASADKEGPVAKSSIAQSSAFPVGIRHPLTSNRKQ